MNGSEHVRDPRKASPEVRPLHRRSVFAALLLAPLAAVLVFKLLKSPSPSAPMAPVAEIKAPVAAKPISSPAQLAAPSSVPAVVAQSSPLEPDHMSGPQLIDELAGMGNGGAPITAEQAARFKKDLAELIRRGPASVAAIKEFMEKFDDTQYAGVNGGDQLGYASMRFGMIDALKQIGGTEAQGAMLEAMQTTFMPAELLQLANNLNQAAPGQYNDQIVSGAQETIALAEANQLGTNAEVGPAFRALQTFGSANSTEDAAVSNPQQFYTAVQLASLPNGQGLDSLVQMQQTSTGSGQAIATEMIAQLAGQSEDALNALTQMAQNGQISQNLWVQMAPILAGSQYQIDSSGQNYNLVNGANTPDEIDQRIGMINSLINFVPPGSSAAKSLQQQLSNLGGN